MITRVIKPRRISIYFPSPEQQDKKEKKRDIKLQPRNALWVQQKILMCNTQETTTFNQEKCCSSGESDMDISDMTRKFSDALTPPMQHHPLHRCHHGDFREIFVFIMKEEGKTTGKTMSWWQRLSYAVRLLASRSRRGFHKSPAMTPRAS